MWKNNPFNPPLYGVENKVNLGHFPFHDGER